MESLSDGAAVVVRSIVGFFTGFWQAISGLISTGIGAIAGLWEAYQSAFAAWALVAVGAGALWTGLATLWQSGTQRIQEFWNSITAGAAALWDQLNSPFAAGFEFLSGGWAVIVAAAQAV